MSKNKNILGTTFKTLFSPDLKDEEMNVEEYEKSIRNELNETSALNSSFENEKAELKDEYKTGLEEVLKERETIKKVSTSSMEDSQITANKSSTVKVLKPRKKEDAYTVINHLKNEQVIFVMLNEVELNVAREIFDILSGALYFAGYKVETITDNQYLIDPSFK